jgi:hypothetical protein
VAALYHKTRWNFFSYFFLRESEFIALELGQTAACGPHKASESALGGACPVALWATGGSSSVDSCASTFYLFHKKSPKSFVQFRELWFLHKNNTMVVLLKTALVRISFIWIRVQNKSNSVWKSRYDGDVSGTTQHDHTTHHRFALDPLVKRLSFFHKNSNFKVLRLVGIKWMTPMHMWY